MRTDGGYDSSVRLGDDGATTFEKCHHECYTDDGEEYVEEFP